MSEQKTPSIDDVLKNLNKEFGDGSVGKIGEKNALTIDTIKTNCLSLDHVLACGGLPRGRILEVFGEESSGKSTLCMFLTSQVQKQGGKCVWIDAECSFSNKYAKDVGVDVENLILSQPTTGEEGLKIVRELISTNSVDLIVVDSVAALVPAKELGGEISDAEMAQQARMMSKALRVLAGSINKTKTIVIFINQLRDKIGVYWGTKHSTPGGKALKFYSSIRLEVKSGKKILDKDNNVIGNLMKIKAIKNKTGMPFRETEFELIYSEGVDLNGDLLDFAVKKGIIERSGNSYSYGDVKLGVGRDNSKELLSKSQKLYNEIKNKLDIYEKGNKKEKSTKTTNKSKK